jgi:hypothetical protein
MSREYWQAFYPAAGLLLGTILVVADGWRGFVGALLAWLICGVPILTQQVAKRLGVRKKTANRGLIAFPPGLLPRMAWTLCAASVAYYLYEDRLGVGFWIAVLVLYQAALVRRTRNLLDGSRS